MGIVVDFKNSDVTFKEPFYQEKWSGVKSNTFKLQMLGFTIKFCIYFDPDPNKGVKAPSRKELWRIGIVQNVVYVIGIRTYEDKSFPHEFKDPIVDSDTDPISRPFCSKWSVSDIWYTSQGYGELLNPWSSSGVTTNNKPDSFDMWDYPSLPVTLRRKNGAFIRRAEQAASFQTWLVAETPKGLICLAHVPTFWLGGWLETTPGFKSYVYGGNEIARKLMSSGTKPTIKPALGNGGRDPKMNKDDTANLRQERWLEANGL